MRNLPMTALNRKILLKAAKLAGMSVHARRDLAEETKSVIELRLLSKDKSPYVRAGLVINDRTPTTILTLLAREASAGIRFGVLQHHNTPKSCAKLLSHDKDKSIKNFAKFLITMRKKMPNPNSPEQEHREACAPEGGEEASTKPGGSDGKKGGA